MMEGVDPSQASSQDAHTMLALVKDKNGLSLQERPIPDSNQPGKPPEALVRVLMAGICRTDLEIARGYMQFEGILGHEFVGIVEKGPEQWLGKRVCAEINFGCGQCADCLNQMQRHCAHRRVLGIVNADGAIAEYVSVPISNLHQIPDGIGHMQAVFIEPLAAAYEILEQVRVHPSMKCLVFGDGKLGQLIAQVLSTTGADVTLIGNHEMKLYTAAKCGIRTVLFSDWVRTPSELVVDATGRAIGLELALENTKPRGTIILKSTTQSRSTLHLAPIVIHEITVLGSRCGPFAPALQALATNKINVYPLMDMVYPLTRAMEAIERAKQGNSLKVIVECGK